MPVVIVAGAFGMGKSTFIMDKLEKISKKKKRLLFALVKKDYPIDIINSPQIFFGEAVNSKDSVIVIDEARVALPKSIPQNLNPHTAAGKHIMRILKTFINARKLNNFIFIIFHSLGEIPLWIIQYCDMLVRFKTKDQMQYQRTRFKSFGAVVESIDNFPTMEKYECDMIELTVTN